MKRRIGATVSMLLLFFIFAWIPKGEAALQDQEYVLPNKVWTIVFSTALDEATVHGENIYIEDKSGNRVNTMDLQIEENGSAVKVTNQQNYEAGQDYVLHIKKGLKSTKGKFLKNEIVKPFTIINSDEDNWAYYSYYPFTNTTFPEGIYKYNMKTKENKQILKESAAQGSDLYIVNDWVYYIKQWSEHIPEEQAIKIHKGLYKAKTDGTEETRLLDEEIENFTIYHNEIYYTSNSYIGESEESYHSVSNGIYKMDLNGHNRQLVFLDPDKPISSNKFVVKDDAIYFSSSDSQNPQENGVYEVSLNNTNATKLSNIPAHWDDREQLWAFDDYLIYAEGYFENYVALNVKTKEKVSLPVDPNLEYKVLDFYMSGKDIYYVYALRNWEEDTLKNVVFKCNVDNPSDSIKVAEFIEKNKVEFPDGNLQEVQDSLHPEDIVLFNDHQLIYVAPSGSQIKEIAY